MDLLIRMTATITTVEHHRLLLWLCYRLGLVLQCRIPCSAHLLEVIDFIAVSYCIPPFLKSNMPKCVGHRLLLWLCCSLAIGKPPLVHDQ